MSSFLAISHSEEVSGSACNRTEPPPNTNPGHSKNSVTFSLPSNQRVPTDFDIEKIINQRVIDRLMLHDLKNKLKEKDSQIAQLKDNRRQLQ